VTFDASACQAEVELWFNGRLLRSSTVSSATGAWGFGITGQEGTYVFKLKDQPVGAYTPVGLTVGGQDTGGLGEFSFTIMRGLALPVPFPHIKFLVENTGDQLPCEYQAPSRTLDYVFGQVKDQGINPNPIPPLYPPQPGLVYQGVKGAKVEFLRWHNGAWQNVGGVNVTGDKGFFGWGATAMDTDYVIRMVGVPAGYAPADFVCAAGGAAKNKFNVGQVANPATGAKAYNPAIGNGYPYFMFTLKQLSDIGGGSLVFCKPGPF